MKRILIILITIIVIGCEQDENPIIQNIAEDDMITESVNFSFDGVNRSFVKEYSWKDIASTNGGIYSAISDDHSDDGIWFGMHLTSDFQDELNALDVDQKLAFAETALTNLEDSFVRMNTVLDDDLECCFVCHGEFQSLGFSVNLLENISDCGIKEIWSSTYGQQINAQLQLKKITNLINPNVTESSLAREMIMATFDFKCSAYNNIGEQKDLIGEITVPIHAY